MGKKYIDLRIFVLRSLFRNVTPQINENWLLTFFYANLSEGGISEEKRDPIIEKTFVVVFIVEDIIVVFLHHYLSNKDSFEPVEQKALVLYLCQRNERDGVT